jgi:hypothetical protein
MAALGLAVPAMSVQRTYFFGPWAPEQPPKLWGDGIHDDLLALNWYLDRRKQVPKGFYFSSDSLRLSSDHPLWRTSDHFCESGHGYRFLGGVSSGVLVKCGRGFEWREADALHQRAWWQVVFSPKREASARRQGLTEERIAATVAFAERRLELQKFVRAAGGSR